MDKHEKVTSAIVLAVCLYLAISSAAFAFRHPEMTQTQIYLNFVDVIFWK